ncbi:MAG: cytochrome b [Rhizobiaceae bacterium]|nr:cytochrome b [Rhizobiaceae bacterium]
MKPLVYSLPQRALHWLTAALVLYSLLLPGQIERVADLLGGGKTPTPAEWTSANIHIYIGFAVLGLTLLRIVLRLVQGAPAAPVSEPAPLRVAAAATHGALYLLLLAMPAAGIAKFYFGVGLAGFIHGGPMKLALWILVGLHVAAALVHMFYWKTDIMQRMTSGRLKSAA